jgi:hypothetical protein
MAYATLADVKIYTDIQEAGDNALVQRLLNTAQRYIDAETNRTFEASTATRYYTEAARDERNSTILHLDADLLTVTELLNGDTDQTEITATDYWLLDRNEGPPYHWIQLTTNGSSYWQWDTDGWVEVTGTWGYTTTAPADITQATAQLATYLYRQKDSQVFDVTAIPEAGVITIPQGIPATVKKIIDKYRRMI